MSCLFCCEQTCNTSRKKTKQVVSPTLLMGRGGTLVIIYACCCCSCLTLRLCQSLPLLTWFLSAFSCYLSGLNEKEHNILWDVFFTFLIWKLTGVGYKTLNCAFSERMFWSIATDKTAVHCQNCQLGSDYRHFCDKKGGGRAFCGKMISVNHADSLFPWLGWLCQMGIKLKNSKAEWGSAVCLTKHTCSTHTLIVSGNARRNGFKPSVWAKQSNIAHQLVNGKFMTYHNQWWNEIRLKAACHCVPWKRKVPGSLTVTFQAGEMWTDCMELFACSKAGPFVQTQLQNTSRDSSNPNLFCSGEVFCLVGSLLLVCRLHFLSFTFKWLLFWFPSFHLLRALLENS